MAGELLAIEPGDPVDAGLYKASQPPESAAPDAAAGGDSLDAYLKKFVLDHQHELSETELARRLGISRKSLWERRTRLNIPRPRT